MSASEPSGVDILFKEHSFEEIESVRDNLAHEIDKRTELLKSIVKEKYKDVVETSDAVQSMKQSLNQVESSIKNLDKTISEFYERSLLTSREQITNRSLSIDNSTDSNNAKRPSEDRIPTLIANLSRMNADLWEQFDSGSLKDSVKIYREAVKMLQNHHELCQSLNSDDLVDVKRQMLISKLGKILARTEKIIKNRLWSKIQSAEPTQIGIIDSGVEEESDDDELFKLSLESSIEFLVEKFERDSLDTSYQAQIRRHQPSAFFNSKTNEIEAQLDEFSSPSATGCYIRIPKYTSIELSCFLHEMSRVINTISGFYLSKLCIREGLRITIQQIVRIYSILLTKIETDLKAESRRRRAMQIYFDLMYVRVLLNSSKDIELIEELDPQVSELAGKYELLLDSIELYMVSDAMHANVLQLSHSTIRLYGLLIPNLQ